MKLTVDGIDRGIFDIWIELKTNYDLIWLFITEYLLNKF